ncbi:MAG: hypothetical protein Q8P67_25915 [archaeon]|nr:hypothetical protein [archaeon]
MNWPTLAKLGHGTSDCSTSDTSPFVVVFVPRLLYSVQNSPAIAAAHATNVTPSNTHVVASINSSFDILPKKQRERKCEK